MAQSLIAEDATVVLQGGAADDGGYSTDSENVTLRFRTVKFEFENKHVDVTAANDVYERFRVGHKSWTCTASGLVSNSNTKYPDLTYKAFNNALAQIACTLIGSGKTLTVQGVIQKLSLNIDEPDTEELVLRPGEGTANPTIT